MAISDSISDQFQDLFDELKDGIFGNERQSDFAHFAKDNEFLFVKRMFAKNLEIEVKALSIFRKKRTKRIYNLMTKDLASKEGRIAFFDYRIYGEGHSKRTSCLLIKSRGFNFPHFRIKPKTAGSKFSEIFFPKRVFLNYNPEFNKKYTIRAKFQEDINAIIGDDLADLLMDFKKLHLEGLGSYILVYRKHKLCDIKKIKSFIALGLEISGLLAMEDS